MLMRGMCLVIYSMVLLDCNMWIGVLCIWEVMLWCLVLDLLGLLMGCIIRGFFWGVIRVDMRILD